MNIGYIACIIAAVILGLVTIIFAILKERAAILISGFHSFSKGKRALYDTVQMSTDFRNSVLIWTVIMGVGAVCSLLISQYAAIIAYIVWLILFFKDVHFDNDKAFEKYKIK